MVPERSGAGVPWYRFPMLFRKSIACAAGMLLVASAVLAQGDVDTTLRRASALARDHRYDTVVELLEPLGAVAKLNTAQRFELHGELGRALFHLGRYPEAYRNLQAALKIQPRRMEIGVYLEAAAWATGRREEALQIFDAILASGARDLYLPVTLPGERSFLANAEVWEILARHRRPLPVDLEAGSLGGVALGDSRSHVVEVFHLPASLGREPVIRARAGPEVLWFLHFDPADRLDDIVVDVQHVLRYTPYDLRSASGLDWKSTPAQAMVELGPPAATTSGPDGTLILDWHFPKAMASLEFGKPPQPLPPSLKGQAATLLRMRLHRPEGSKEGSGSP